MNQNKLNVTPATFSIDAFDKVAKELRAAHKASLAIGPEHEAAKKKRAEAQVLLQEAVNNSDFDEVAKLNAVCKRLNAKLEENPVERDQAFDKAVNALFALVTPVIAEVKSSKAA